MKSCAAVIGAGVIGTGWICRFVLHGWDVKVFDQAADTVAQVEPTLNRARQALAALYRDKLPAEGQLLFVDSIADAVTGVDWVQESIPETLALKRDLYTQIARQLPADVPLASSTSGFKPSDLAADLDCASQLLVCHPFNPVYLLPAVEVVAGRQSLPTLAGHCAEILRGVGMQPLVLQTEIDAHIADRLMEALWREALWLIADGVATTQDIDEVMRHSFGLRWAQMGLFETYRLAGGEAGMHHFLEQFGPALAWPWSRLTDVPAMDQALIEK
ncbi:MAG: 3-hydroxyacyl-CoA dehydrogenase NAD-binding domain-containing protein, partial [Pseudomonadota bacterium]